MENILIPLILLSLVGLAIGLVSAIIKKVRRKSAKKSLGLAVVSFAVFIAATIALPEPSVEQQIGSLALSGTYISINKDRELVFDGKTATLYENGEQIQTGTYEYNGERSINIVYKDYAELLIYTSDTKEILYQGNGNAMNLGDVEYVKEGVANPDLTALDIEYPPSSIYYNGGESQSAVVSNDKLEKSEEIAVDSKESKGECDDAEYIGDDLWLKDLANFSEGRAWIQFRESDRKKGSVDALIDTIDATTGSKEDLAKYELENIYWEGTNRAALIDTQGKILWESELTKNNTVLQEKSEFKDGLAYCIFDGNDKRSYIILDSDGNVTHTRDCDENYIILGHGGGLFLVAQHTANLDSNEWKVGAIDKNGNMAVPFQAYEKNPPSRLSPVEPPSGTTPDPNYDYSGYLEYQKQLDAYMEYENYTYTPEKLSFDTNNSDSYLSCKYLGENIYKLDFMGFYILLNIDTQSVIYTYKNGQGNTIKKFISNFENGAATVLYGDGMTESVGSLGTDGTFTQIASNDWIQYQLNDDMEFSEGLTFAENESSGAYYNMIGEKVIDFPQYHDKNSYYCDPFYSGYAAMSLKGADGLSYFTVINKNGDLMFEPKSGFSAVYTSKDGKYVTAVKNGSITVFDIKGNPLVSIDYVRITPAHGYEVFEYNVCDGVIKIEDFYVNVEDGTAIGLHGDGDANFSVTLH